MSSRIPQDGRFRKHTFTDRLLLTEAFDRARICVTLIPSELRARLLANGQRSANEEPYDFVPVVRLFVPGRNATWLLTELDPDDPDLAYGLCDLGLGAPKLDYIRLSDLLVLPGNPVQCDTDFIADKPLSAYLSDARLAETICSEPLE